MTVPATDTDNAAVNVEVLGPVRIDGAVLSPRERALLAALAVRRGERVTAEELAEALWGGRPPASWRKQVQIAIGRLRRSLGPDRIETLESGYALRLADDELDVARFESLLDAARRHAVLGEAERAAVGFDGALALWHGTPYADLPDWPPGVDEASRLAETRRTAEEELVQARLDSGLHRSVVPDAQRLVRADPTRERRWSMLATALYRSGRQAEALAALREARQRLRDEYGLEPGRELTDLEAAILRQDPALDPVVEPQPTRADCPYHGLGAFDVADADDFFGRQAEVAQVLDRLVAHRLVVLAGASGSGKSSLMRAGAIPALRTRGLTAAVLTPGSGGIDAVHGATDRSPRGVIAVDQFEELFHLGLDRAEVDAYGRALTAFAAAGGTVLITVRSDALDRCTTLAGIGPLLSDCIQFVGPMTSDGLRAAIEEPARLAGLRLEHGLTELILRDLDGQPAALPHMSHALVQTWARREGAVLTVAGYQASGGISGAIAQSAETLYQQLDPAQRELCRSTLLRLVGMDADGVAVRRRTLAGPLREDAGRDEVLARLTRARLVITEERSVAIAHESLATAWPRLRGWLEDDLAGARIMRGLTIAAEDWAFHGESESDLYRGARLQAALEWRERTHPDLTGIEARFLAASTSRERGELEAVAERARVERRRNRRLRGLLSTVVVLLALSLVAGAAALVAQRHTAQARTQADAARIQADAARDDARINSLVATSIALRSSQRDVAALLAAEVYRRWPDDPRARNALMSTLTAAGGFLGTRYLPGASWIVGAATPDGRSLVLVTDDGTAGIYDAATLTLLHPLALPRPAAADPDSRPSVAVSADGRTAVIAYPPDSLGPGRQGSARLTVIDVPTGTVRRDSVPLPYLAELALSPDGARVALTGPGGESEQVDLSTGKITTTAGIAATVTDPAAPAARPAGADPPTPSAALSVAYAPDGRPVTGRGDGTLDVAGRPLTRVDPGAVGASLAVAGNLVITTGSRLIAAIDLADGRTVWSAPFEVSQPAPCQYLAASSSAGAVFCGDQFGRIQRRDLASGRVTAGLDRQHGAVGTLTVSADGAVLTAVGGEVAGVSRWRLDGAGPVTRLIASGQVAADGFDGATADIVTATRPAEAVDWDELDQFRVWDTATDTAAGGAPIQARGVGWVGTGHLAGWFTDTERIEYLDVASGRRFVGLDPIGDDSEAAIPSRSGRRVYLTFTDGRVRAVNPTTGGFVGPVMTASGKPTSVSASPGDRLLAVASVAGPSFEVVIFDTATGAMISRGAPGAAVVAIAPNGELYAATLTGTITRYAIPSLTELGTLPGARGEINSLQFSDDGSLLLATANDSTVSLYDATSGQRLGDPIPSDAPFIIPGFLRPDGTQLLVDVAGGVAAWDLDPRHQFDAACAIAGRQLTAAEWRTYLADLGPYRETC